MELTKTAQIKAQLIGQPILVVVLALVGLHLARKYQIEVSADMIMLSAVAVGGWWTSKHVDKTSGKLDARDALIKFLSGMGDDQIKQITKTTVEAQAKGLAGPITTDTVALAHEVVAARVTDPNVSVQDVLERTKQR